MLTRRFFVTGAFTEAALAQRASVRLQDLPPNMVWLNANENPAGPPAVSLEAIRKVLAETGRYHFQEFRDFHEALARSVGFSPAEIVSGAGSTEVLNIAVQVFTSATRPLVMPAPTFEAPAEMARALGRPVVTVPLREDHAADVRRLAAEAAKAGAGLVYLCNPNNPTSAITTRAELAWLVENLPPETVLAVDEAYLDFAVSPDIATALPYVRQGRNVVVTRTFSKIYGMAGLRAGFAIARPALMEKMAPYHNSVISIVAVRAVLAALALPSLVPERRAALARTRHELCAWLRERTFRYIEPHANFIMIDVGRDARHFIENMPRRGVAVGRPFPPLESMLRVTIGADADMARFRDVFWQVHQA
jgi:histidinol-phosphate aminotransferase